MRNINRNNFWFRAIKPVHKKSYPLNEFSLTFWLTPVLLRLAAVHYRDYDWNYLWTDDGQMWWNLSKKALVCICRVTIDFKQNLKKMKIKDLRFQRVADMTRPLPNKQRLRLELFTFSLVNSMFVVREALTGRTLVYFWNSFLWLLFLAIPIPVE